VLPQAFLGGPAAPVELAEHGLGDVLVNALRVREAAGNL